MNINQQKPVISIYANDCRVHNKILGSMRYQDSR